MKKIILCLTLTLSIFALYGCGGSDSPSSSKEVSSSESSKSSESSISTDASKSSTLVDSENENTKTESEFSDSIISCAYDSSILEPITGDVKEDLLYSLSLAKPGASKESTASDIPNGSCLYIGKFKISPSEILTYNETLPAAQLAQFSKALLSDDPLSREHKAEFTKAILNKAFSTQNNTKKNTHHKADGSIEINTTLDDSTELKCTLLNLSKANNTFVAIFYRLLPGESEDYVKALNDCYKSIKYIEPESVSSNTTMSENTEAPETVSNPTPTEEPETSTEETQENEPTVPESEETNSESTKDDISSKVKSVVWRCSKDTKVSISDVTINENLGTDDENDYIALVDLSFDVKNSAKITKDMLNLLNNEIGYYTAEIESISELTIFWEVPYLNQYGDTVAKANLLRNDKGLYFEEEWYDPNIFE